MSKTDERAPGEVGCACCGEEHHEREMTDAGHGDNQLYLCESCAEEFSTATGRLIEVNDAMEADDWHVLNAWIDSNKEEEAAITAAKATIHQEALQRQLGTIHEICKKFLADAERNQGFDSGDAVELLASIVGTTKPEATDARPEPDALSLLIKTVTRVGGVTRNPDGTFSPLYDRDWVDLADAYLAACKLKGVKPLIIEQAEHPIPEAEANKQTDMTAAEFMAKFPAVTECNSEMLEDVACPKCGNRNRFHVAFSGVAKVMDDGSDDAGDHEWDDGSQCVCAQCAYSAPFGFFKFEGLDEAISNREQAKANQDAPEA